MATTSAHSFLCWADHSLNVDAKTLFKKVCRLCRTDPAYPTTPKVLSQPRCRYDNDEHE
jgi:hypothetical protein